MVGRRSALRRATPETVEQLQGLQFKQLVDHANALINGPMPDHVFEGLIGSMAAIGTRRDRAVCPDCGGPADPVGESAVCIQCRRSRYVPVVREPKPSPPSPPRTHCCHDHELTDDNVYYYKGYKGCRECARNSKRERAARRAIAAGREPGRRGRPVKRSD